MKRSYTSEPLSPPSASSAPRRSEAAYSANESANENATAALMSGRYASYKYASGSCAQSSSHSPPSARCSSVGFSGTTASIDTQNARWPFSRYTRRAPLPAPLSGTPSASSPGSILSSATWKPIHATSTSVAVVSNSALGPPAGVCFATTSRAAAEPTSGCARHACSPHVK